MLPERLNSRVKNGSGRIIWAFDEVNNPFKEFKDVFEQIQDDIAAVKFNHQLILPFGLKNKELLKIISMITNTDVPLIMDAKINDFVANEFIARSYFEAGFDAVICTPFIGTTGLEPIISASKDLHKDFIFLTYMSHSSSDFGYGRRVCLTDQEKIEFQKDTAYFYELFAHLANKLNASGCIVGATFPEKIKEIRTILQKDKLIISPGIGKQGGNIQQCRKMGMDYAIIGRAITQSDNVKNFVSQINQMINT